jgi:hypothetical protein
MPFEHSYGDSLPSFNDYFDFTLRSAYLSSADVEAELLWVMNDAVKRVRPSIITGMVKAARDDEHLIQCLKSATMATLYPEEADNIATRLVDTFKHTEAHKADNAYNLVFLSAAEEASPDENWQSAASLVRRLIGYFDGGEA